MLKSTANWSWVSWWGYSTILVSGNSISSRFWFSLNSPSVVIIIFGGTPLFGVSRVEDPLLGFPELEEAPHCAAFNFVS